MEEKEEVQPIVGHHAGWGLSLPRFRIEPYKLTSGSVDTMCVRVREKIDIHGVGTDVVVMEGTFTVRRDDPCAVDDASDPKWGESCVATEFRSLELYGESPLFGTVRVHLDPTQSSYGMVGPSEAGSLAASCVAHCYPIIELPELGMRLSTAGQPVNLASKVVQIPPVGDVARSDNSAMLVDEDGNTIGEIVSSDIEVGDVLCSFPLGSTRPRSGPEAAPHIHAHGIHDEPSGPGFYAETRGILEGGAPHIHEHPQGAPHVHEHPAVAGTPPASKTEIDLALQRIEAELRALAGLIRGAVRG